MFIVRTTEFKQRIRTAGFLVTNVVATEVISTQVPLLGQSKTPAHGFSPRAASESQ
jgi:hypothetical protein